MNDDQNERTPWWASIVTRITLVLAVLVASAAFFSGWLVYQGSRDQLVNEARTELRHTLESAEGRMSSFSNTLADDIAFLSDNAPLHELTVALDSADTTLYAVARDRMALLMESFIRSRKQYAQVRVIGADSLGRELIRFDRSGGVVTHVPDSALQAKGDRDYYREAMTLLPGQRYFSPMDLNKEHGRVQVPWMPTLRAAATFFSPRGRLAGIVVINADARPLFDDLSALGVRGPVLLANEHGELIAHPDTALVFRFEFGGSSTLDQALKGATIGDAPMKGEGSDWIAMRHRFEPPQLGRSFELAVMHDTGHLLAGIRRQRDRNLLIAGGVAAFFILLTALFAGGIARGLSRLTRRVERYAAGTPVEELPLDRRDEIGRLSRSLDRMRQRIDQRVHELEEARHAAEESDRARRELLANMSHEVRTPLNAIIGMGVEIDATFLSDNDRERLALVQRSAQRLKGLVDDLLLHARIGEGRLHVKPSATDVRQLLNDLAQSHRPVAGAKGIALRVMADRLPPQVWTDPLRLHQIADNLMSNAVKFTRSGTIDVKAHVNEEGLFHLSVSDTGPGLSPEERARVFERFERATSAESDNGGAGLGLAITRRLVDLLSGTITVESEPGRGSTFSISLPLALPPGNERRSPPIDVDLLRDLRVLYVEDVASNRMVVEQWAGQWGWELTLAANAEEAMAKCDAKDLDLVLLDLDLGEGMRGSQLGMRMRGLKRLRYVPMLAVTAYVGEEQEAEILRAGLNDRVTKPIDKQDLFAVAAYWCADEPGDGPRPALDRLEEQYDHDPEKLLSALQQYRREFTQWRIALRPAFHAGDEKAIAALRHKLRPHAELLGIEAALGALDIPDGTPAGLDALERSLEVLRSCDRALMRRQRELQAITTGRAS